MRRVSHVGVRTFSLQVLYPYSISGNVESVCKNKKFYHFNKPPHLSAPCLRIAKKKHTILPCVSVFFRIGSVL